MWVVLLRKSNMPAHSIRPCVHVESKPSKLLHTQKSKDKAYYRLYRISAGGQIENIREVEATKNRLFLHRQSFYIIRTGILIDTYRLYSFEESVPIEIDVPVGYSLTDYVKVFHRGTLIVIRQGTEQKAERLSKKLIEIIDFNLDTNCVSSKYFCN
ncbi:hypothetical protein PENTCL1PPCAC_13422 [Pristionchus entomophagus]|uniref:Uncharacterized protein n=1 Tax=Pristionchus entomophagus TaxID=358040 RepID=A0AAV5TA97_9BILA|nr:hypothetical protein PENTCL1PPCAC_13422 [Pristionchus entomophagus]